MKFLLMFLVPLMAVQVRAYVGAISTATAESGRASVEPTDSPFLNPASLPHLKGYFFTTGYSSAKSSSDTRGQDFAVTVTDNLPDTLVPTAFSFLQSKTDLASEEEVTRDLRLSFGNEITSNFAMGFSFRYKDDQLPEERFNQVNLNVGTLYAPNPDLGFALVLENVLGGRDEVPVESRLTPTTSLGASYIYRRFLRTRLDVISAGNNSFDRPILAVGLESYFNRWVIIRMGAQRRNEEDASAYSGGLGFAGPRFGIHYAYFTSPEKESLTRHSVDLAIPIW